MPRPIEVSGPTPKPPAPVPRAALPALANRIGSSPTAPKQAPVPNVPRSAVPALQNRIGVAQSKVPSHYEAVRSVFDHQSPAGQAAIVKGLKSTKVDRVTQQAVNDAVKSLNSSRQHALAVQLVNQSGSGINSLVDEINPAKLFTSGLASGNTTGPGVIPGAAAIQSPVQKYAKIGSEVTKNALKDAINTPAQTFSTIGTLGGDVVGGHPGKALSDLVSPYKQLVEHPGQTFLQHPLNTALMVAGPLHGASRIAAGGIRALAPESAAGRAVSTERPGIQLGGNATHEQPRYSPYPAIKAGQVAVEKAKFKRAPTGELVPRSETLRAKLAGMETSRSVGVNERIRQANREHVIAQRSQAVMPSLADRAGHGVKTALRYDPKAAAIPGADVLARIADATIRRPDTFREDLLKHIQQVSSNRPNLLETPKMLKEHDANVKALVQAAKTEHSPADLARIFKAADAYASDYKPVQDEAQRLGQFGARSSDALLKRTLMHYAVTHMGARMDSELGLVDAEGKRLSNSEIIAHLKGPDGTGGRMPAFTSDKPKQGSAFYVSQERRPLPQNKANTLFAYTHGLTDASHQALLEQHVRMQGIVDAHKAQNRLVDTHAVMKPDGTAWPSYQAALKDAPTGYVPIALSQPFHALDSLDKALEGTDPAKIDEEAQTHGLDLNARLNDTGQGRWGLVDETVLKRINQHTAQITSNSAMRGLKMANNQFRQVALGTSAKHVPGVISEGVIRSAANAEGISSWITGRRLVKRAEQLDPELGGNAHIQLTGGTVAGSAKMMMTRQVSDHFAGTNLHGPLKAFEAFMRAPGARQMRGAWKAWLRLAINGTKRYIEENNQMASLGKAALRDFGSEHGPFIKALRLQGAMLDDAAKGLFDAKKLRQLRAEIEQVRGRWTDLTPTGQTAMMLSPFGLWWTNSVKWLARSPVDRPIQTGALAAATTATQQERSQKGLDLFAPNAVPGYMQGGIPVGGTGILAQNYYSPFGVANEPIQSAASLIEPWLQSPLLGSLGDDYLGKQLNSPTNPHGDKASNTGQKVQYIVNSLLASFLPLYSKAEQIAEGGASAYDSSTLVNPQTKTPGQGPLAGAKKALRPYRLYQSNPPASKSSTGWGGGATSSSGWGGSAVSSGGWG